MNHGGSRLAGLVLVAMLGLLQAGCATMSQGDCMTGDWGGVGYQDGVAGHPPSRLSDHVQACSAYGVLPDRERYFAARERGLDVYCTPYQGFEAGRLGRKYHGVCPPMLAEGFLVGYDNGLRVHAATEHHDDLRSEVRELDRRIDDTEDDLDDIHDRLDDDGLSAEARKSLQRNREHLREDLHRMRRQRDQAVHRERAAADHAANLRHMLSQQYRQW